MQHSDSVTIVIINNEPLVLRQLVAVTRGRSRTVRDYLHSLDALAGLAVHGADVIILDWTNPPLHRSELFRKLRREYPQAAIIYVSPHDQTIAGMLCGEVTPPDDIIATPAGLAELTERIDAVIHRYLTQRSKTCARGQSP